jgi:hypothetical protein
VPCNARLDGWAFCPKRYTPTRERGLVRTKVGVQNPSPPVGPWRGEPRQGASRLTNCWVTLTQVPPWSARRQQFMSHAPCKRTCEGKADGMGSQVCLLYMLPAVRRTCDVATAAPLVQQKYQVGTRCAPTGPSEPLVVWHRRLRRGCSRDLKRRSVASRQHNYCREFDEPATGQGGG